MCGLVCAITKAQNGFSSADTKLFNQLLFIDMLRGEDSTGAFGVSNEGDVYGLKSTLDSPRFIQTDEYDAFVKRSIRHGSVMVGHNRKATKGSITDANAHPFVVDNNIVLVHNGTMWGDHKKHADVDVDSHAIAHLIHEKGNVAEALSSFNGAYALIWYDVRNASLHMVRNEDRPLWWMETNFAWFWSSEPEMLDFICRRENLALKSDICQLPVSVLQTYKLRGRNWDVGNTKLDIKRPVTVYQGGVFHTANDEGDYADWAAWAAGRAQGESGGLTNDPPFPLSTGSTQSSTRTTSGSNSQPLPGPRNPAINGREPPDDKSICETERRMCNNGHREVEHGEWISLQGTYPYNTTVKATPFDFEYVNGEDDAAGFFLYAHPLDDRDVVIRHYFPKGTASIDRIIQLSTGNNVYEFTLGNRRWAPLDVPYGTPVENMSQEKKGYCIFRSTHARLLHDFDKQPKTVH